MYPSLISIGVTASVTINFLLCGYTARLLWKRDRDEREARVEVDTFLKSAITDAVQTFTHQNVNNFEALMKAITFNHSNIATCVATIQQNNTDLQKSNLETQAKILHDVQTEAQLLAQTLKPVIDWCYISEAYVREFRAMKMKTPTGLGSDECGHCHKQVNQWFIDGAGRTTCSACKPEGFRDAVDRGIARL